MISYQHAMWFAVSVTVVTYFMFQKKMLSKSTTELVSKLFFYPTFPITALLRTGNYWTQIDETVCIKPSIFAI